jgi:hypothetical protein
MTATPEQIITARDAWLAAKAAHEAQRLEVNRLWLEYLQLADPGRGRRIRRLLKCETDATRTAGGLFPEAMGSLEQSIPLPTKLQQAPSHNPPPPASTPPCGGAGQNCPFE